MSDDHPTRRHVLKVLSALGIGSVVFGRALTARAEEAGGVTEAMIKEAEWISGLSFSDEKRALMMNGINESLGHYQALRGVMLDNGIPPALVFHAEFPDHASASSIRGADGEARPIERSSPNRPTDDKLVYLPVTELSALLRDRKISSTELTQRYLDRMHRLNPTLQCVINFTEELAMEQAARADRELDAGYYRGPLHGVPWGAKDIIAVPNYPTTWGAEPYRMQERNEWATVADRLTSAGAVLIAKLAVGALAWGDVWFGGTCKNPWNPEQGSSGSSAGSASATAAGLAGFTLGTETWGSIVSPCTRCGATGLRPTYGRVSRHGVMALSWSMDKIGPIARSVEDCALVFDAIRGTDGNDTSVVDRPFRWPMERDPRTLKVGYVPELFEEDRTTWVEGDDEEALKEKARYAEWMDIDRQSLKDLEKFGFHLNPVKLTSEYPIDALQIILTAEAATAFDELTRGGQDDLLVRQEEQAWPNVFRQGQLIPAVEYIRANRIRTLVMREMEQLLGDIDVLVLPSYAGNHLLLTNLTGHPSVVVPNGFRSDGTPTSLTFTGRLFGETELLAVAHTYQSETEHHLPHPKL